MNREGRIRARRTNQMAEERERRLRVQREWDSALVNREGPKVPDEMFVSKQLRLKQ